MHSLYFVLFLGVVQGTSISRETPTSTETPKTLGTPSLLYVSFEEGEVLLLEWTAIGDLDVNHPLSGYKINVWEVPDPKTYTYEQRNNLEVVFERSRPVMFGPSSIPKTPPQIRRFDSGSTRAIINGFESNKLYQVRVQGNTREVDGPLSDGIVFKVLKGNKKDNKDNNKDNKQGQ